MMEKYIWDPLCRLEACNKEYCHNYYYKCYTLHIALQWYSLLMPLCHADVMAMAHFPNYWSSMREIHRSTVDLPYKGQVTGSFSDFCDLANKLLNIQLSYRWLGKPWHSHGVKAMITRDIYANELYSAWRCDGNVFRIHYRDVIMGAIASQITSLTIVYSTVYSDADQRKHQSFASLAFVWGIHRGPGNSPHKWPVTR